MSADPKLVYSLYIGNNLYKTWSAASNEWRPDPNVSGKKKKTYQTRLVKIPFECCFASQDVSKLISYLTVVKYRL